MHTEMIQRGFDKFSSNVTLSLAAMVDPRMRDVAIKDKEAFAAAKNLLFEEASAIQLEHEPASESHSINPLGQSDSIAEENLDNEEDESILSELKAEAAASIRANRVTSKISSHDEVRAYLSVPNIVIGKDPLKWYTFFLVRIL